MSKSIGNVVDPLEQFSSFGVEQVRYFLLKEGFLHHDGGLSSTDSHILTPHFSMCRVLNGETGEYSKL